MIERQATKGIEIIEKELMLISNFAIKILT